jgi:hypothetical protein
VPWLRVGTLDNLMSHFALNFKSYISAGQGT